MRCVATRLSRGMFDKLKFVGALRRSASRRWMKLPERYCHDKIHKTHRKQIKSPLYHLPVESCNPVSRSRFATLL
jgi:hypothetical protein